MTVVPGPHSLHFTHRETMYTWRTQVAAATRMHATATATAGAGRDAAARALSRRGRAAACAPRRRHLYMAASLPPVHDRDPLPKDAKASYSEMAARPAAHAMHALSYVAGRLEICARLAWPWPSPTQSLHCSPGLLCSCCPVALLGELANR